MFAAVVVMNKFLEVCLLCYEVRSKFLILQNMITQMIV